MDERSRFRDGGNLIRDAWEEEEPDRASAPAPAAERIEAAHIVSVQVGVNYFEVKCGHCYRSNGNIETNEEAETMAMEEQGGTMSAKPRRYVTIPQAAALTQRGRKQIYVNLKRIDHLASLPDEAVGIPSNPDDPIYRAILVDLDSLLAWHATAPRGAGGAGRPQKRKQQDQ